MFYPTFEKLCKEKGVKKTRALIDAGLPKSAAKYWENHFNAGEDPKPTNQNAVKLAQYFGVTVDYLLTGEKEKAPAKSESLERKDFNKWVETLTDEQLKKLLDMGRVMFGE